MTEHDIPSAPQVEAEKPLKRIEIPTLMAEREAFRAKIIGQEEAVEAFATLYAKLKSGIKPTKPGPIDIKYLAGPSGVGKTEMVYTFAEILTQGKDNPRSKVLKINGGEYQQDHMIARLIGSPPGYRGSEDPNVPGSGASTVFSQENLDSHIISYTDNSGREQKVVIILIDEAEKAHEDLHRAFLSVLDKGQMDMANNKSSDFTNAVIFYTSNVGNESAQEIREELAKRPNISEEFQAGAAREIFEAAFHDAFPPEFSGRIKELLIFNTLTPEAIAKITDLKLKNVEAQFVANQINIRLIVKQAAKDWIISRGYNTRHGARALEKVIEKEVHDNLVLAHVGMNIHRKEIVVDKLENEPELAFFFNEGEQLPDLAKVEPISVDKNETDMPQDETLNNSVGPEVPLIATKSVNEEAQKPKDTEDNPADKLPSVIKTQLAEALKNEGVNGYIYLRSKMGREGLLPDTTLANKITSVRNEAKLLLFNTLAELGLSSFAHLRDQIDRAGIYSKDQLNNWSTLRDYIRQTLISEYKSGGVDAFSYFRDQATRAGIGSTDEWNNVLNDIKF